MGCVGARVSGPNAGLSCRKSSPAKKKEGFRMDKKYTIQTTELQSLVLVTFLHVSKGSLHLFDQINFLYCGHSYTPVNWQTLAYSTYCTTIMVATIMIKVLFTRGKVQNILHKSHYNRIMRMQVNIVNVENNCAA